MQISVCDGALSSPVMGPRSRNYLQNSIYSCIQGPGDRGRTKGPPRNRNLHQKAPNGRRLRTGLPFFCLYLLTLYYYLFFFTRVSTERDAKGRESAATFSLVDSVQRGEELVDQAKGKWGGLLGQYHRTLEDSASDTDDSFCWKFSVSFQLRFCNLNLYLSHDQLIQISLNIVAYKIRKF